MKYYILSRKGEGIQQVMAQSLELTSHAFCFHQEAGTLILPSDEVNFWEECDSKNAADLVMAEFARDHVIRFLAPSPLAGLQGAKSAQSPKEDHGQP